MKEEFLRIVRVVNWEMEREKKEGNMGSHFLPEVVG